MATKTAAMVVIGDEILSGRIQDLNAHHLAGRMAALGIPLIEIRTVPDDHGAIAAAIRALSGSLGGTADYLFTSGGIGPTHDDITADAVAAAHGVPIDVREDARALLLARYGENGINAARLRMARIPQGAALIDNPVSAAPGFRLGSTHVMAGVPEVFRAMLAGIEPSLTGGPPIRAHGFEVAVAEGDLAADLAALDAAHPAVSVGCYPYWREGPSARVVLRAADPAALAAAATAARALLETHAPGAVQETPPS
ncbi:MAG: competence/damage-inducible protein A [Pseudomonadota bacterium]